MIVVWWARNGHGRPIWTGLDPIDVTGQSEVTLDENKNKPILFSLL